MLSWKVVSKERLGSNAAIYGLTRSERTILPKALLPYFPIYAVGEKIDRVPKSPGIMCFDTRRNAEKFKKQYSKSRRTGKTRELMIIPVYGDKLLPSTKIIGCCGGNIWNLIEKPSLQTKITPPNGTRFFESVQVLSRRTIPK